MEATFGDRRILGKLGWHGKSLLGQSDFPIKYR
jgi:hypothetical protein